MTKRELSDRMQEALEPVSLDNVLDVGSLYDKLSVPNDVLNRCIYQQILEEMPLTVEEVPKLNYEIDYNDYLNGGGGGVVYSLGEKTVGKILRSQNPNSKHFYSNLLAEAISQELAHRRGVKVPKVEGIFKIKRKEDGQFWPTLVMQKIDGKRVSDIGNPGTARYEIFSKLGELEKAKATKRGVFPLNSYDVNFMASAKKQETYLIDCDDWHFKGLEIALEIKNGEED